MKKIVKQQSIDQLLDAYRRPPGAEPDTAVINLLVSSNGGIVEVLPRKPTKKPKAKK